MLNRVIPAVVSKFEPVSIRSQGTTNELMPKANSEDWHTTLDQSMHRLNGIGQACRVAGAIG